MALLESMVDFFWKEAGELEIGLSLRGEELSHPEYSRFKVDSVDRSGLGFRVPNVRFGEFTEQVDADGIMIFWRGEAQEIHPFKIQIPENTVWETNFNYGMDSVVS